MCQQSESASTPQKTDAADLAPTDLSPTTNRNDESSPIRSIRSRARHSRTRHSRNRRGRCCAIRVSPPPLPKKRMQPISLQHQMTIMNPLPSAASAHALDTATAGDDRVSTPKILVQKAPTPTKNDGEAKTLNAALTIVPPL